VPLCAPKIPRGLTWDRIWVSAVTGSRITAWTTARTATSSESCHAHIYSKEIPCYLYVYTYTYIFFLYYTKIYNQLFFLLWFTHMYIVTRHAASTVCRFVCLCCHLNLVTYSVLGWKLSIRSTVYKSQTTGEPSLSSSSSSCSFSLFTMSVSCVHMPTGVVQVPGCEPLTVEGQ